MVVDVTMVVNAIFQLARSIKEAADQVRKNQKQCRRLGCRIDGIVSALKPYKDRTLQTPEVEKLLNKLKQCLERCQKFVNKQTTKGWHKKFVNHRDDADQFSDLNEELSRCVNDLNLGINVNKMFNPQDDKEDQATDLRDIEKQIADMDSSMNQEFQKLNQKLDSIANLQQRQTEPSGQGEFTNLPLSPKAHYYK